MDIDIKKFIEFKTFINQEYKNDLYLGNFPIQMNFPKIKTIAEYIDLIKEKAYNMIKFICRMFLIKTFT